MNNLYKAMSDLLGNKERYYISRDGDNFESQIKMIFKKHGLTEVVVHRDNFQEKEISNLENIDIKTARDIWKDIKNKVLEKNSIDVIKNPFRTIKDSFIFQPNGSQNFPDFLVFTGNKIIPIEIKYSKKNDKNHMSQRPMWNSNIPKANAIYIFGVASSDLTTFLGSDILPHHTRMSLNNYFNQLDKDMSDIDIQIKKYGNNFGLYPYVRKAFDHKANKSTYIDEYGKNKVESYFSDSREKRENNVMNFLKEIK